MLGRFLLLFILILPMIGSLAGWLIGKKNEHARNYFGITLNIIEFAAVCLLSFQLNNGPVYLLIPDIMGEGLYLKLDDFRYIFVFLTSFIWMLATYYSTQYLIKYKNRNRYFAFFMLTLSSTIGVFISQDLLNLFTFFELMSFSSYLLVIHDEDKYAHKAGASYIAAAIIGGMFLLMGLFLLYDYTGTLNLDLLPERVNNIGVVRYLIASLMLVGFGVKAGMVPLHVWLPEAYAAAPSSATAILSGILSKTGAFGILLVSVVIMKGDFYVSSALSVLGLMTMFIGGLLAVFQKHLKRILAFSSMSQIGYIILGIGLIGILGEHSAIAVYGTLLHIINHSLLKVLLFLSAGIIYLTLHGMNINMLRGFGRNKHLLKLVFFIGLMGMIGVPGFNGFTGKSLLHEALVETQHLYHSRLLWWAEILFIISSAFTVVYMLKIFVTVFVENNTDYYGQYKKHMNIRGLIPPAILSLCVVIMGFMPEPVLGRITKSMAYLTGHEAAFEFNLYTAQNIYSSVVTLAIGAGMFVLVLRRFFRRQAEGQWMYFNPIPDNFNLEEILYIPLGRTLYWLGLAVFSIIDSAILMPTLWITAGVKQISKIRILKSNTSNRGASSQKFISGKTVSEVELPAVELPVAEAPAVETSVVEAPVSDINIRENLSKVFERLRYRFNSIMYGIFIFAIVLVITMYILITN